MFVFPYVRLFSFECSNVVPGYARFLSLSFTRRTSINASVTLRLSKVVRRAIVFRAPSSSRSSPRGARTNGRYRKYRVNYRAFPRFLPVREPRTSYVRSGSKCDVRSNSPELRSTVSRYASVARSELLSGKTYFIRSGKTNRVPIDNECAAGKDAARRRRERHVDPEYRREVGRRYRYVVKLSRETAPRVSRARRAGLLLCREVERKERNFVSPVLAKTRASDER